MDVQLVANKAAETATHTMVSTENVAYLMGLSFVIGSLFTIFILVLLDFMKRDRNPKQPD